MRDMLILCSGNDDAIAKTVGVNTGTCQVTQEKNADDVLATFVEGLNEVLDADAKAALDSLLSGQESSAEKIKILEESDFVNNADSNGKIKEALTNFINTEDFSSAEDITCI